jgi:hypothetical protein
VTSERHQKLRDHATALGDLLVEKQTQYGDSVGSSGEILRQLYPNGIRPDQYDNLQLVVRVLDKLKRIATQGPDGTDLGGESPWRDVAGYGILGLAQAEQRAPRRQSLPQQAFMQPQCMKCAAPLIEHVAGEGGVVLCPCPPFVPSCRGCKHAVDESPSPLLSGLVYCRKTNRPSVTARVEPEGPRPTWCPGYEAQP